MGEAPTPSRRSHRRPKVQKFIQTAWPKCHLTIPEHLFCWFENMNIVIKMDSGAGGERVPGFFWYEVERLQSEGKISNLQYMCNTTWLIQPKILFSQLMEAFKVATYDQNLMVNGVYLTENEASLGQLKVLPGSLIFLRVSLTIIYLNIWWNHL